MTTLTIIAAGMITNFMFFTRFMMVLSFGFLIYFPRELENTTNKKVKCILILLLAYILAWQLFEFGTAMTGYNPLSGIQDAILGKF